MTPSMNLAERSFCHFMTMPIPGDSRFPTATVEARYIGIDEASRRVTHELNADLGSYAFAVGAAQRLLNGNYQFTSGFVGTASQSIEVRPNGQISYVLESQSQNYRSFRMKDMYNSQ